MGLFQAGMQGIPQRCQIHEHAFCVFTERPGLNIPKEKPRWKTQVKKISEKVWISAKFGTSNKLWISDKLWISNRLRISDE